MNKITERDIYTSMIDGTFDPAILAEFGAKKLAQLDHRNMKAKERAAAKRAEGDELTEKVYSFVNDDPQSREDITNALVQAGIETTIGKVGYRLTALVNEGKIVKEEINVPGTDGGKAKRLVVYSLAY